VPILGPAAEKCQQPLVRLAARCPRVYSYSSLVSQWAVFADSRC